MDRETRVFQCMQRIRNKVCETGTNLLNDS